MIIIKKTEYIILYKRLQNLLQIYNYLSMETAQAQNITHHPKPTNFQKLEGITVLIIFLLVVIISIYLISTLLIFIRKIKQIIKSKQSTKAYYLVVFVYIISKMILCSILLIQIISQIPNNWQNLKGQDIELVLKNSIQLADLSIIQLFMVSLYSYLKVCFIALDKDQVKKIRKYTLFGVKIMVVVSTLAFLIPLVIFDFKLINYELLNGISCGFNAFVILLFLASFFYLNFKMTGILVEARLNAIIKKLYKVLVVILISRIFMVALQITMAFKIHDGSFQSFMEIFEQIDGQFVAFGICFIGALIIILLTEGLPIMYSLKNTVLQAFSYSLQFRDKSQNIKQSMISSNSQVLHQHLLNDDIFEYDQEPEMQGLQNLSLKRFKNLTDLKDKEDSIWSLKRGQISNEDFLIKMAKHQISTYIIEDMETQISKWNELKLSHLNIVTHFKQKQFVCILQKYQPYNLDGLVDKAQIDKDIYFIALDIAKALQELHKNDIVHGSLKPSYILFDNSQKIYLTGLGLQSFKKYLSLITGYTNKSMYSAVQVLADKNNIAIKATKQSDVYSFGMIFYQMITKNRIYRQQTLKQCRQKFYEQKARPKIPENMNIRVKALIRNCWQDDPSKRPTISDVILNLKKILEQY